MQQFDCIIIGAGPGGYNLAAGMAAAGKHTLLIESDKAGGTCLNRGCIPTKALRRSARLFQECAGASAFGVTCPEVSADFGRIHERVENVVSEIRQGVEILLSGVERTQGVARFISADTVEVAGERFTAPLIVVATGSKPAMLPIEGAQLCMTSDDLLAADHLPDSMVSVGGGVIGMEFACILAALGVGVTVIEYCKEILPPFDQEVAKRLRMLLKRKGVNIITSAAVKSVEKDGDRLLVSYEAKNKLQSVSASQVLMAVGRRPVVPEGLEAAGAELTPRGFLKVNEKYDTTLDGVKAIGDVNGLCLLAHAAEAQAHAVLHDEVCPMDCVPAVAFTDPECAMAGLTEEAAAAKGIAVKTGKAMFRANGYAMALGEHEGFVKVIADAATGKVIGVHIIGPGASELVAEGALAVKNGLTAADVCATIHAHPTLSETLAAACKAAL